jgi:hypothetical protein
MTARLSCLSSIHGHGNDAWGVPAERFQRHEELKDPVRVIADVNGMRRVLLVKGHMDGEQHLVTLPLWCYINCHSLVPPTQGLMG